MILLFYSEGNVNDRCKLVRPILKWGIDWGHGSKKSGRCPHAQVEKPRRDRWRQQYQTHTNDDDPVIVIDSVEESANQQPTENYTLQKKAFSAETHEQQKAVSSAQDSRPIETSDAISDGLLKK